MPDVVEAQRGALSIPFDHLSEVLNEQRVDPRIGKIHVIPVVPPAVVKGVLIPQSVDLFEFPDRKIRGTLLLLQHHGNESQSILFDFPDNVIRPRPEMPP